MKGLIIRVRGIVQGVGFRPFVYRIATEEGLCGFVRNTPAGVEIRVESENGFGTFLDRLRRELPPLARIDEMRVREVRPLFLSDFRVDATRSGGSTVFAPPDLFMCDACRAELQDVNDRRYHYPFINCTECGPRYTLLLGLPYDRERTTMRVFPMCPDCQTEYESPPSRRFHAEPNACPTCGPALTFIDSCQPTAVQSRISSPASPAGEDEGEGAFLTDCRSNPRRSASLHNAEPSPAPSPARDAGEGQKPALLCQEQAGRMSPIDRAVAAIREGKILALKSLGGFHLICDPFQSEAIARLRELKQRSRKPLALMARDVGVAETIASVSADELRLLTSPQRPIVLLRKKKQIDGLSPGLDTYGVMLPYTPLHSLLLQEMPLLVATSANEREGPILKDEGEEVAALADCVLTHNRPIANRCDDSVVRVFRGNPLFLRRARGYVPDPLWVPRLRKHASILALGAEMKDTITLLKDGYLITSQYLGDMKDLRNLAYLDEALARFRDLFSADPAMVCCDLHPGFTTTRMAERTGKRVIRVQHHIAHVFAVIAEHDLDPRGGYLGVAFDGLGYGDDGTIWGGEFFALHDGRPQRRWHLRSVPQPGGDLAAREPWRMALSWVRDATGELPGAGVLGDVPEDILRTVGHALAMRVNAPLTSSVGRLFDAVAALAGVSPQRIDYEAEAAMRLECAVEPSEQGVYPFGIDGEEIDVRDMIRAILHSHEPAGVVAAKLHNTLASVVGRMAEVCRDELGIQDVVLSGGVFLNTVLLERSVATLEEKGFTVHYPRRISPGDEAISVGQALYAAVSGD